MKKRNLRSYTISTCLVLGLLLTGCAGTKAVSTEGDVTTETVAESSTVDTNAVTIDYSSGIPDEAVVEAIFVEGINGVVVNSHNIEEITNSDFGENYIARDTVNVSYNAGDITGLLPQKVSKDLGFYMNKSTSEWELLDVTLTSCEVDNVSLPGTSWKCVSLDENVIKSIFGDDIDPNSGTVYLHFLKRMGVFAFNLTNENNTDNERFFTTAQTNGKLYFVSDGENIEKSFSINSGSVSDSGELKMDVSSEGTNINLSFGSDAEFVTEYEYDMALGNEIDETKVYLDTLQRFDLTTSSLDENGEWKLEIGYMEGNLSPALSWEAVDGATKYAIIMMDDTTTNNWFHWYNLVDGTSTTEGEFTDSTLDYFGPYPPETHEYDVYVIALADEPKDFFFELDAPGGDIYSRLNDLNTKTDGSIGNVLAYGLIEADYTPGDDYYGDR